MLKVIFPVLKLIDVVGWTGCHCLLVYEYRKGLSETWSAIKLFWTLNLITSEADLAWGANIGALSTKTLIVYSL